VAELQRDRARPLRTAGSYGRGFPGVRGPLHGDQVDFVSLQRP